MSYWFLNKTPSLITTLAAREIYFRDLARQDIKRASRCKAKSNFTTITFLEYVVLQGHLWDLEYVVLQGHLGDLSSAIALYIR